MKNIIITGNKGTIGNVLSKGLQGISITGIDFPEYDLDQLDVDSLAKLFTGYDAIIHLAWNSERENFRTEEIDTRNIAMAFNVFRAAIQSSVPRVIMASSTQADDYRVGRSEGLLSPYRLPIPKSPYGASKTMIEALGRYYAQKGLEVVCLRLGSIRSVNHPRDAYSAPRFVTHADCCSLVQACLDADSVPENYAIIHGVSANTGAVHDTVNPFGWRPKEDATLLVPPVDLAGS